MGRTMKRVPLNFDWPLGQVWKGYVFPYHPAECYGCKDNQHGGGLSKEAYQILDEWYNFDNPRYESLGNGRRYDKNALSHNLTQDDVDALVKAGRLMDFTHTWTKGEGWKKKKPAYKPTAEEVNEWSKHGIGHDSSNAWIVAQHRCKKMGVSAQCAVCHGSGELWQSPEMEQAAEAWEPIDPPKGKGYQLWETTSEGSPKSPVFRTLEELCAWAEKNATTFASYTATKEEWREMLDKDFVSHTEGNLTFM